MPVGNAQYAQQLVLHYAQLAQTNTVAVLGLHQAAHREEGGNALAHDSADGDAGHAQMAHYDEEEVEGHVHHAAAEEIDKGPARVTHRAQYARAEVVHHHGRHSGEDYAHIQHGLVDDIRRGAHEHEHWLGQEHTGGHKDQAGYEAEQYGRVHGLLHVLPGLHAEVLGHHHAAARGQPQEQIYNKVVEGAGRADGSHGVAAVELSHHDDIRGVEQQLQYAGQHQRHGKTKQLAHEGPAAHVYCHITVHRASP